MAALLRTNNPLSKLVCGILKRCYIQSTHNQSDFRKNNSRVVNLIEKSILNFALKLTLDTMTDTYKTTLLKYISVSCKFCSVENL